MGVEDVEEVEHKATVDPIGGLSGDHGSADGNNMVDAVGHHAPQNLELETGEIHQQQYPDVVDSSRSVSANRAEGEHDMNESRLLTNVDSPAQASSSGPIAGTVGDVKGTESVDLGGDQGTAEATDTATDLAQGDGSARQLDTSTTGKSVRDAVPNDQSPAPHELELPLTLTPEEASGYLSWVPAALEQALALADAGPLAGSSALGKGAKVALTTSIASPTNPNTGESGTSAANADANAEKGTDTGNASVGNNTVVENSGNVVSWDYEADGVSRWIASARARAEAYLTLAVGEERWIRHGAEGRVSAMNFLRFCGDGDRIGNNGLLSSTFMSPGPALGGLLSPPPRRKASLWGSVDQDGNGRDGTGMDVDTVDETEDGFVGPNDAVLVPADGSNDMTSGTDDTSGDSESMVLSTGSAALTLPSARATPHHSGTGVPRNSITSLSGLSGKTPRRGSVTGAPNASPVAMAHTSKTSDSGSARDSAKGSVLLDVDSSATMATARGDSNGMLPSKRPPPPPQLISFKGGRGLRRPGGAQQSQVIMARTATTVVNGRKMHAEERWGDIVGGFAVRVRRLRPFPPKAGQTSGPVVWSNCFSIGVMQCEASTNNVAGDGHTHGDDTVIVGPPWSIKRLPEGENIPGRQENHIGMTNTGVAQLRGEEFHIVRAPHEVTDSGQWTRGMAGSGPAIREGDLLTVIVDTRRGCIDWFRNGWPVLHIDDGGGGVGRDGISTGPHIGVITLLPCPGVLIELQLEPITTIPPSPPRFMTPLRRRDLVTLEHAGLQIQVKLPSTKGGSAFSRFNASSLESAAQQLKQPTTNTTNPSPGKSNGAKGQQVKKARSSVRTGDAAGSGPNAALGTGPISVRTMRLFVIPTDVRWMMASEPIGAEFRVAAHIPETFQQTRFGAPVPPNTRPIADTVLFVGFTLGALRKEHSADRAALSSSTLPDAVAMPVSATPYDVSVSEAPPRDFIGIHILKGELWSCGERVKDGLASKLTHDKWLEAHTVGFTVSHRAGMATALFYVNRQLVCVHSFAPPVTWNGRNSELQPLESWVPHKSSSLSASLDGTTESTPLTAPLPPCTAVQVVHPHSYRTVEPCVVAGLDNGAEPGVRFSDYGWTVQVNPSWPKPPDSAILPNLKTTRVPFAYVHTTTSESNAMPSADHAKTAITTYAPPQSQLPVGSNVLHSTKVPTNTAGDLVNENSDDPTSVTAGVASGGRSPRGTAKRPSLHLSLGSVLPNGGGGGNSAESGDSSALILPIDLRTQPQSQPGANGDGNPGLASDLLGSIPLPPVMSSAARQMRWRVGVRHSLEQQVKAFSEVIDHAPAIVASKRGPMKTSTTNAGGSRR